MAVLLTGLLVTMGGWAALIGPSEVFIGPGPTPSSETTTTSEAPVDAVEELDRKDIEERDYGATTSIVANVSGGAIQLAVPDPPLMWPVAVAGLVVVSLVLGLQLRDDTAG